MTNHIWVACVQVNTDLDTKPRSSDLQASSPNRPHRFMKDWVKWKQKYLKSGLVNFILPCSVAIFSAKGTNSSHLDRTHSLSHLDEEQPIIRRFPRRRRSLKWRIWWGTLTWSGSLSSWRHWDHKPPASSSHGSKEEDPEGPTREVDFKWSGLWLKWTVVSWSDIPLEAGGTGTRWSGGTTASSHQTLWSCSGPDLWPEVEQKNAG